MPHSSHEEVHCSPGDCNEHLRSTGARAPGGGEPVWRKPDDTNDLSPSSCDTQATNVTGWQVGKGVKVPAICLIMHLSGHAEMLKASLALETLEEWEGATARPFVPRLAGGSAHSSEPDFASH